MSHSEQRSWLVAYDVTDPRRLGRVHRFLKRHAIPVQYSVFVTRCDERKLEVILGGVEERINPKEDDIRAYHIPDRCEVSMLGAQHFPDGIMLPAVGISKLLHNLTARACPSTLDWIEEMEIAVENGS